MQAAAVVGGGHNAERAQALRHEGGGCSWYENIVSGRGGHAPHRLRHHQARQSLAHPVVEGAGGELHEGQQRQRGQVGGVARGALSLPRLLV